MKKLYEEFFHIPENGKIREKVMLTRVAITVGIMVACLIVMSLTAYAYFTSDVTSRSNLLRAADFRIEVSVEDENGNPVLLTEKDTRTHTVTLPAGDYRVEIHRVVEESSAETGFCVIRNGTEIAPYHTQQLGNDPLPSSITFQMTVLAETDMEFFAHWGTSSYYGYTSLYSDGKNNSDRYVLDGEVLTLTSVPNEGIYVVEEGDNLWEIARKFDVTTEALLGYNSLESNLLQVGDILLIPPQSYVPPVVEKPVEQEKTEEPETPEAETPEVPTEPSVEPETPTPTVPTEPESTEPSEPNPPELETPEAPSETPEEQGEEPEIN